MASGKQLPFLDRQSFCRFYFADSVGKRPGSITPGPLRRVGPASPQVAGCDPYGTTVLSGTKSVIVVPHGVSENRVQVPYPLDNRRWDKGTVHVESLALKHAVSRLDKVEFQPAKPTGPGNPAIGSPADFRIAGRTDNYRILLPHRLQTAVSFEQNGHRMREEDCIVIQHEIIIVSMLHCLYECQSHPAIPVKGPVTIQYPHLRKVLCNFGGSPICTAIINKINLCCY